MSSACSRSSRLLGKPARGKTCDAILGIIEEGKEVMEDFEDSAGARRRAALRRAGRRALRDRALRHAQDLGRQLGMKDAVKLLDQTLQEEIKTDKLLSRLATQQVNAKAA